MFVVRMGDTAVGICPCPPSMCPATGIVASGSFNNIEGGFPVARMGDIVMFPCGSFVITSGTFNNIEAGLPVARIGASCVGAGSGIIVSGSFNHLEM